MGQAETLIVYEGELKSAHFLYSGNDFKYYLDLFKYFQIFSLVHSQPVLHIFRCHLTHHSVANNEEDVFNKFPSSMLK